MLKHIYNIYIPNPLPPPKKNMLHKLDLKKSINQNEHLYIYYLLTFPFPQSQQPAGALCSSGFGLRSSSKVCISKRSAATCGCHWGATRWYNENRRGAPKGRPIWPYLNFAEVYSSTCYVDFLRTQLIMSNV